MNRPLSAIWLVVLLCVFAIFVWGINQDSPEPPRIPASVPDVTPIDTNQGDILHVIVDNLPTAVPDATRGVWKTPTSAVPACPGTDGALCQVMAPQMVVPTTVIAPCTTETIATFVPGEICRWETLTATSISTPGGPFK